MGNVVVDTKLSRNYEVQLGQQEWTTTIECISVVGEKIAPLVIFKSENFLLTDFLKMLEMINNSLVI